MDKIYDFIATVANANDGDIKVSYFEGDAEERRERVERIALELLGLQLKYGSKAMTDAKVVSEETLSDAVKNAVYFCGLVDAEVNDSIMGENGAKKPLDCASKSEDDKIVDDEVKDALGRLAAALLKNKNK